MRIEHSDESSTDVLGAVPVLYGESHVAAAERIVCGYDPAVFGTASESGRTEHAGDAAADGAERIEQRVAGPPGYESGR